MAHRGFTVLEMASVIVVIGVLSSIALPKMNHLKAKAVLSELVVQFSAFERLASAQVALTGEVPSGIQEIGFDLPSSAYFTYESLLVDLSQVGGSPNAGKNQGKGQAKQIVCHGGHSITIADPAVYNAHLAHGDGVGSCAKGSAELLLKATLQVPLASNCSQGSVLQSQVGLAGALQIEYGGACMNYMVR